MYISISNYYAYLNAQTIYYAETILKRLKLMKLGYCFVHNINGNGMKIPMCTNNICLCAFHQGVCAKGWGDIMWNSAI